MTATTAEYEKAKQTPPTPGQRVRVTIEGPADGRWPDMTIEAGERIRVLEGDTVTVEIIKPTRPTADALIVRLVASPGEPDKVRVKAAKWTTHPQVYTFQDAAGQIVAQFEATKVVYAARESAL